MGLCRHQFFIGPKFQRKRCRHNRIWTLCVIPYSACEWGTEMRHMVLKTFLETVEMRVSCFQYSFRRVTWVIFVALTLNGPWYDFVPVSFSKLLNASIDRMVEKLLNKIFRRYFIALHKIMTWCLRNQENGTKKSKNWAHIFRFSSFRLWPLYPTGINIGSKWR